MSVWGRGNKVLWVEAARQSNALRANAGLSATGRGEGARAAAAESCCRNFGDAILIFASLLPSTSRASLSGADTVEEFGWSGFAPAGWRKWEVGGAEHRQKQRSWESHWPPRRGGPCPAPLGACSRRTPGLEVGFNESHVWGKPGGFCEPTQKLVFVTNVNYWKLANHKVFYTRLQQAV